MNCNSENNITKDESDMLEMLTKKNAEGLSDLRTDTMPVMVPIQEKDWDTMVNLLQAAVDFQPQVFGILEQLVTSQELEGTVKIISQEQEKNYGNVVKELLEKLRYQQTGVENLLLQMKDVLQQAGKNQEKIMNDFLEQGRVLEKEISKATARKSLRIWIIRLAISVAASASAALLSALLCVHLLG